MVGTLGRKLAPKIPRLFDESILVRVKDGKFLWTTSSNQAVVKSRSLELKAELLPTFAPIVKKYHERRRAAELTQVKSIEELGLAEQDPPSPPGVAAFGEEVGGPT